MPTQPPDWVLFLGRFHPLIVHLPIGFLVLVALLELGRLIRAQSINPQTITIMLWWSAVGATVACGLGYLLSLGGGYDQQTLQAHQWQGIGVAGFAWLAWAVKAGRFGNWLKPDGTPYGLVLGGALTLLLLAGHLGGSLTHGADYLTQYTPASVRALAGLPPRLAGAVAIAPITDVQQALVYAQIINPILQSRCVQCHNAGKIKGDLRLDSPDQLRKGGKEGPVLVAGNGSESALVKRCLLDEDDEHHMPPKSKTPLTPAQISLLRWWIDQGASFDKRVADLPVTTDVQPALALLGPTGGGQKGAEPVLALPAITRTVPAADQRVISKLVQMGWLVSPLASGVNQLEVSAVNQPTLTDAQVALLLKISPQVVWLKVGDTPISDVALRSIAQLTNLEKLHLERTAITDAGLKNLTHLPHLEYLNLYGTAITDKGLMHLASLKSLRQVYVWQTRVTSSGRAALQKALPDVDLVGGLDEKAPNQLGAH